MTEKNLKDQLTGFYQGQSLSGDVVERLSAEARMRLADRSSGGRGRRSGLESAVRYGLAACLAILLVGGGYLLGRGSAGGADHHTVAFDPREDKSGNPDSPTPANPAQWPKLVAVKVHADWCGRCPTIAPVFAELTADFGNRPVLFVTLDITDDLRRQQARYLARSLGIEWVFDESFESGIITLVDREQREVVARLTDRRQKPQLVSALTRALPGDS